MLYKRKGSSNYWTRFRIGGREVQQSTGTDKRKDAEEYEERLRARIWREIRLGERHATWNEAVEKWKQETLHLRPRTRHRNDEILQWFAVPLDRLPLSAINQDVIDAAKKALLRDRTPSTANRYLAILRAVLNKAVEWGMLRQAPKIHLFKIAKTDPAFITREQFVDLMKQLPEHTRRAALFSVLTGLRMSNVRDLVWGRVDLENARVWIPSTDAKGKTAIGIPLADEAVELLRGIERVHERVFTYTPAGEDKTPQPISGTFNTKAYRKALARAKLTGVNWHTLRHSWASWMAMEGTPALVLKELGAWKSLAMVERYAHLNPDALAAWAKKSRTKTGTGGA
jgi:integrase